MISATPLIAKVDLANLAGWVGVPTLPHRSMSISPKAVCSERSSPEKGGLFFCPGYMARTSKQAPQTPYRQENLGGQCYMLYHCGLFPEPVLPFPKEIPIFTQVASPTSCSPWTLGEVDPKSGGS